MAETASARVSLVPWWQGIQPVQTLPPLAAFLGSAWVFSVTAGGHTLSAWLLGFVFSAFVASLTAAVGASTWFQQVRARSRLRHLHRLRDEGMLTEAEVDERRRVIVDGL